MKYDRVLTLENTITMVIIHTYFDHGVFFGLTLKGRLIGRVPVVILFKYHANKRMKYNYVFTLENTMTMVIIHTYFFCSLGFFCITLKGRFPVVRVLV